MVHFLTRHTLLTISLCVVVFSLTSCGKKAQPSKEEAKTEAVSTQSGTEVQQQALPTPSTAPITEERTYYNFESDNINGWEVPMWAEGKTDHVAREAVVSQDVASLGTSSMKVTADFPGNIWSAALVEIQQYLDLSKYRVISTDIYIPKDAPEGLKAKLILTVGENWKFVEMNGSAPLVPGQWVTVTANIEPGSYDWKRVVPDEEFAQDIRKIAIRIESNKKPKYFGPIYIDNVRAGR